MAVGHAPAVVFKDQDFVFIGIMIRFYPDGFGTGVAVVLREFPYKEPGV